VDSVTGRPFRTDHRSTGTAEREDTSDCGKCSGRRGWTNTTGRCTRISAGRGRRRRCGAAVQWIGNYLSRALTGHGVRVSRVLLWTALVLLAPWYWYGLVEGWTGDSLRGGPLYYSVVTFVTSPPHPIPAVDGTVDLFPFAVDRGSLIRAVVLFQTYAGTALIVLLGYVLGNRDPM